MFCMGRPRPLGYCGNSKIQALQSFPLETFLYETLGTDAIVTKLLTLYLQKTTQKFNQKKLIEKVTLNRAQG